MNNTLFALDIETSIISAILFNPSALSDTAEILSADDFYSRDNAAIFGAMLKLFAKNEPIDDKFIAKELGNELNKNALNEAMATSGVVDVAKYAKLVKELSKKRELLAIAQGVPKLLSQKSLNETLEGISSQLYALSSGDGNRGLKNAQIAAQNAAKEILHRKEEGNGLLGISSGFSDLDYKLNGLKKGDFIIIAARPGMGKTTFALNIVEKVLNNGVGVVFFSLEMPAEQLIFRMISSLTSIDLDKIYKGVTLSDIDIEHISATCDRISQYDFFIYDENGAGDENGLTTHKIRTEVRRLKEKNPNIGLCVIDYIGLMANSGNFSERHLQIAEISRSLKMLAREMQMPIIALSQLNRALESRANKKPQLSDLRESGAIEQDADSILFVYREEFYKEQESKERNAANAAEGKQGGEIFKASDVESAKIIIGKNRNGATGEIEMSFDKRHSRFMGIERVKSSPAVIQEFEQ